MLDDIQHGFKVMSIALDQPGDEPVHKGLQIHHERAHGDVAAHAALLCFRAQTSTHGLIQDGLLVFPADTEIGRASCRERV